MMHYFISHFPGIISWFVLIRARVFNSEISNYDASFWKWIRFKLCYIPCLVWTKIIDINNIPIKVFMINWFSLTTMKISYKLPDPSKKNYFFRSYESGPHIITKRICQVTRDETPETPHWFIIITISKCVPWVRDIL